MVPELCHDQGQMGGLRIKQTVACWLWAKHFVPINIVTSIEVGCEMAPGREQCAGKGKGRLVRDSFVFDVLIQSMLATCCP